MEWKQTFSHLIITLQLSRITKSDKLDVFIANSYVKLNFFDPNELRFIDFFKFVSPESLKISLEGKSIHLVIEKSIHENWEKLEFLGSKQELIERRKIAEKIRLEEIENLRKVSKDTVKELNDFVITKSLEIGDEQRKALNYKKSQEKQDEVNKLIQFTQEYEKNSMQPNNYVVNSIKQIDNKINEGYKHIEDDKNISNILLETNNSIKQNKDNEELIINNRNNEIYETNPKIEKNNTEIRSTSTYEVNLTRKLIPHYAARESIAKDPPMPKSKILKYKDSKNQEVHDERNPLWIKQKGDNFFQNKDFKSAILSYNNALEIDQDFLKAMVNKATCYLCLGDFQQAEKELIEIEYKIEELLKKCEKDEIVFYQKLIVTCNSKLYSIYSIKGHFDKALEKIDNIKLYKHIIHDEFLSKINEDENSIIKKKIQNDFLESNKEILQFLLKVNFKKLNEKDSTQNLNNILYNKLDKVDNEEIQNIKLKKSLVEEVEEIMNSKKYKYKDLNFFEHFKQLYEDLNNDFKEKIKNIEKEFKQIEEKHNLKFKEENIENGQININQINKKILNEKIDEYNRMIQEMIYKNKENLFNLINRILELLENQNNKDRNEKFSNFKIIFSIFLILSLLVNNDSMLSNITLLFNTLSNILQERRF